MTALRVLLVDDEPLALRRLEVLVRQIEGAEHIGSASGCMDALAATQRLSPDLVLLDIRMRDGTGFDYVEKLKADKVPEVIFVTAFESHAVQAFRHHAVDYLLKPVELARLEDAFGRARDMIDQRNRAARADELQEIVGNLREQIRDDATPRFETEIWVRKNVTGFVRVAVDDIEWLAAEDDYVRITLPDKVYLLRTTLSDLQRRLDPAHFLRIHRSTIVRRGAVAEFRRDAVGFQAYLSSGLRLRVGRLYAKHIRHELGRAER